MGKLIIALLCLSACGCSRLSDITVQMYGYNRSPWKVTLIVDGEKVHAFGPNTTESFVLKVLARKNYNYGWGPSSSRDTQISYSFYNEGTGTMTDTRFCQVGEDMKTTLIYESAYQSNGSFGYQNTSCYSSR